MNAQFLEFFSRAEVFQGFFERYSAGGGVPKNFIPQSALRTKRSFDYALQITMDRPEIGGLSGATVEEAISWGKVGQDAKAIQVIWDCTISLPIIVAALMERIIEK